MDPTACVQRILDAIHAADAEEFDAAWSDLAVWLNNGGFPPEVKSLGVGTVNTVRGPMQKPRQRISSSTGRYAIQTVVPDDFTRYEFVVYNHKGDRIRAIPCR